MINSLKKTIKSISTSKIYKVFLSTMVVVDFYLLLKAKIIFLHTSENMFKIFPLLVGSSSIIVSILMGYLFTKFSDLKSYTKERLNRFITLQEEFNKYQESFYWFSEVLSRKFNIDRQISKPYDSLRKNFKFWEDDKQKPSSTIFARDFYEVGKDYLDYNDFELKGNLIPEPRLERIWNSIANLGGTLGRYKHYHHVLEELGIDPKEELENIKIVDDNLGLKFYAEKLKSYPNLCWNSLAFWEEQVNNGIEIVERMRVNPIKIHPDSILIIRRIFVLLFFVLFFGTIMPITISSLSFLKVYSLLFGYISIIGFIPTLISVLIIIYKEIIGQIDF